MLVIKRTHRRARGFTLLEAMVAMSILAILAGLAAANFSPIVNSARIRAAALDFSTDLAMARSEAIKRNTEVTLAFDSGNWASGWSVTASGVATPIQRRNALATGIGSSSTAGSFVFNGSGRPATSGSVTFCPPTNVNTSGRRISIDTIGLPRSETLATCP
jgi:type IV fimbrial biogenesis protein FimT